MAQQEVQIQQALKRLKHMYKHGEISQRLYEQRKQELLSQNPHDSLAQEDMEPASNKNLELGPFYTQQFPKKPDVMDPLSVQSLTGGVTIPSPISEDTESKRVPLPNSSAHPSPMQMPPEDSLHEAQEPLPFTPGQIIRQRYRVKGPLGEGGVGQVFLVEDTRFGGDYALKRLHPRLTENAEEMERWLRAFYEHQRLRHPGLVRTYLIDEDPAFNALFYVREYVDGESLHSIFEQVKNSDHERFTIQDTFDIFNSLAALIDEAHHSDFYRLDLSPKNIVFPQKKEDSFLKLLDFHFYGLLGQTMQRANLRSQKTLYYTAPELISMEGQTPTKESNIFALGALLYQMLTGALPQATAVPPSQLNPALPPQLDDILRRAMNPQPQHRYHTLEELANQVYKAFPLHAGNTPQPKFESLELTDSSGQSVHWADQLSNPKPILSDPSQKESPRRSPSLEDASPPVRKKNPDLPSSPGSFSGPVRYTPPSEYHKQFPELPDISIKESTRPSPRQSTSSQVRSTSHSRQEPTHSREKKNDALLSQAEPHRSVNTLHRSSLATKRSAISNADRIARLRSGKQTASYEVVREDVPKATPKQQLRGHQKGLTSLSISSDGRFLASASHDGTVRLWDTQSWYSLHTIAVERGTPKHLCWNPQRELYAYSDALGTLFIHDLQQQSWRWQITTGAKCYGLSWHPTSMSLVVALADGTLSWWSLDTDRPVKQTTLHAPSVHALALHAQGQLMVSGDSLGQISCWRENELHPIWQPPSQNASINVIACFPKQHKALVGDRDGKLHIFDLSKQVQERSWQAHHKSVRDLVIPSHENWFASCGNDQRIHLWSREGGPPICTLSGHQGALRTLALNPTGDWMASGGEESSVCIWDTSLWS